MRRLTRKLKTTTRRDLLGITSSPGTIVKLSNVVTADYRGPTILFYLLFAQYFERITLLAPKNHFTKWPSK